MQATTSGEHGRHGEAASGAATVPSPPPEAPRPLTPRVRRGSWTEPRVRLWWLAAAAVLAASVYFLATRYYTWRSELRVIRNGVEVQALVYSAEGYNIPGRRRPPSVVVVLHYEVGGKKYEVEGYLRGRTESFIIQEHVPIRVDPDEPTSWTARTEPVPLRMELLSGLMLLPPALAFGAVAWWRRRGLLRLWRDGQAVPALVMESRQTALAPRSRFARCAPLDEADKRVFGVYVPDNAGRVAEGDTVWLVAGPGEKRRAVAVAWLA